MTATASDEDPTSRRHSTLGDEPHEVHWTSVPPSPRVELRIRADPFDDRPTTICIDGEMCTYSTGSMRHVIDTALDDEPSTVVIDMSGVTFIDARGLELLLDLRRRVEGTDGVLCIVDPSPCVVRLLEITGHDQTLSVVGRLLRVAGR